MKKKIGFEPFESKNTNGRFLKIAYDMLESKAWNELNTYSMVLYFKFKKKFVRYNGTNNTNNISMPNSEYKAFMNQRTFEKAIDNLIEHGFIKVVEDRWHLRLCTIYGFSTQWKFYDTDAFNITDKDRRRKRKMSVEHISNLKKNLDKLNSV